uniref:Methyltransferase type 11 domain-containing protein n=1 Tax=Trypanosoma congolense (strain IL3000) TaxID=1068625 RepID=G0UUW5_TRYCI|nr:conserved hypothetical protein [Trypanosoma congolense IL3000]
MPLRRTRLTVRPLPPGVVPFYGSALHGYHRGPKANFPEPIDCWISVLGDSVPFYQKSLVICPSSLGDSCLSSIFARASLHLPSPHIAALRRRFGCGCVAPSKGNVSSNTLQPYGTRLPSYISPLEAIAPASLDVVVFAANVFGMEMLRDAPWHLSLAHRCLRPHGVVAIMGFSPTFSVVAPSAAKKDADDFLEYLKRSCRNAALEGAPHSIQEAVRRAEEACDSMEVAHADMYFPFPSVRRRWFYSEYEATSGQVAAGYRSLPQYEILAAGYERSATSRQSWDIDALSAGEEEGAPCGEGGALNVVRRWSAVDPLQALEGCLYTEEAAGRKFSYPTPSLRVHVEHFVVTCSARSINAASQFPLAAAPSGQAPRLV